MSAETPLAHLSLHHPFSVLSGASVQLCLALGPFDVFSCLEAPELNSDLVPQAVAVSSNSLSVKGILVNATRDIWLISR